MDAATQRVEATASHNLKLAKPSNPENRSIREEFRPAGS